MKYKDTAKKIFDIVGGKGNISSATHCVTRLRLVLKDETKVNDDEVKAIPNVIGVNKKSGQYQVILGNEVGDYYKEFAKLGNFDSGIEESISSKGNIFENILDYIAGSMTPLIPALLGGGMLKVLVILLPLLGIANSNSQTVSFISVFGDATYYFLPLLLAYSASQKMKVTPALAMAVGGILLHPDFISMVSSGKPLALFGVTVMPASYSSSVIPILIMVWLMKYIEKYLNKIVPGVTKSFLQPTLVLLVSGFIALVAIGPLGVIVGKGLSIAVTSLHGYAGWLALGIMGALMPLIVMTGMHWAFAPIFLAASFSNPEVLILPAMLASNLAQGAACMAVALKSKNANTKQVSFAAGFSALLAGVTEPALYGVTLKYRKPLYAAMIGGGLTGIFVGFVNLKSFAFVVPSIVGLPQFINNNIPSNFIYALIASAMTITITFVLTYLFGIDEEESNEPEIEKTTLRTGISTPYKVFSPISGEVVSINDVPDETFSQKMLGDGVAIIPHNEDIKAPFNGKIISIFPTKHAIGLKSDTGVELLIHVGLDTVELKGEGFKLNVKDGELVVKGQTLMNVDFKLLKRKGYNTITPIVVTNTNDYLEVLENLNEKNVTNRNEILTIL
ncbi:beta-glucoside-specific PTS transporter subunit IIABC [Lactococcus lactis]|uniref:PTS system sucrose-specific EIIBCA component n=1 Tax=Lactococcus lactis subsp. lactis TaxID=1360 RepID=A0A0V8CNT5_LACLL|nr:beta-glucoside-specific PTS transporter subunit IIABC [Lactococcus lactis]KSU02529.1 PTS system beta-glucoside-specific IIB/C/A component [Lactococcus lactis subsp. lactis]WEA55959.1 beta-glucoside-specific PTS transporter subunit IIABC [Lactococcus lactis]BDH83303.1 PTS beta-glucoside transporter subunit EIIBCA [Lactococcus lactis]